jgi:hypothetical protein
MRFEDMAKEGIIMKLPGTKEIQGSEIQTLPVEETESAIAVVTKNQEQSVEEVAVAVCELTATSSSNAGDRILAQLATALVYPKPTNQADPLIHASALLVEMAPQNATEAMLAVQMVATNDAALLFLNRATSANQREVIDANLLNSTRLLRIFTQQTEAMQRLKGKAVHPQMTNVGQVNVHQGGQAIVGSVSNSRPAGNQP